jgi:integrase
VIAATLAYVLPGERGQPVVGLHARLAGLDAEELGDPGPPSVSRRITDAHLYGDPIQDISDTVGHKSTHVTETVYRHVIVPQIRGGAAVMDNVFGDTGEDDRDIA